MKPTLTVTSLGQLPEEFNEAVKTAREKADGLEVCFKAAPNFTGYPYPFPIVEFKSEIQHRRVYGQDGLTLINSLAEGKLK